MLPISLDQRGGFGPFRDCFRNLDPLRGANVFVSTDEGATWERRGAAQFPNPDWHEHMIIERADGTLWMLARTSRGIMQTTSTDGGRTPTYMLSNPWPDGIQQPPGSSLGPLTFLGRGPDFSNPDFVVPIGTAAV